MRSAVIIVVLLLVALPVHAQTFGGSLAITPDEVFVGETGNQSFPAEVYIYSRADGWAESGRLQFAKEADHFGRALAVRDGVLLAGASGANASAGAVYVYMQNEAGEWAHHATVEAPYPAEGERFGSSIALSDKYLLVSALARGEGAGAVEVYRVEEPGSYRYWATLGEEEVQGFGAVLAIHEDTFLIGTPAHNEYRGKVFIYEQTGDGFSQTGVLEPESSDERGRFGYALAMGGGKIFVGMPMIAQQQGQVVVYAQDEEGEFEAMPPLRAFQPQRGAMFGTSLVFTEGTLWVGAPGEDRRAGAVYRFTQSGDSWSSAQRQTSTTTAGGASFGTTLAVQGNIAVTGAVGVDRREGAAVILEHGDRWEEKAMVISDVKGYDPVTGGEVRCAEGQARTWECDKVDLVSFLPTHQIGGTRGTMSNDIWGWTDPVTGHEYALVGRSDGTAFVDVTNPEMPLYVGNLPMTEGARASVWRDMKVYKDHVYIVADGAGEHGMQVLDLNLLRSVSEMPVEFSSTVHYDGIHSAHNIVINENTGYAFVVGASGGGETCGGGLHMVNIQDPTAPKFEGCFADASTGRRKTGYSHDAQCVVYHGPDARHQGKEICLGSNETALSIADVTDKDNPVALSMAVYPKVAYAHQGWLNEDHTFFYMNDEGDEPQGLVEGTRTLVWDVRDLEDPILVKEYIAETTTTDHNLYIRGNLMYQSNYGSGLRILDITTPDDPVEVGYFDTTTQGGGGSWSNYPYFKSGVIIVTSMGEGLFILKQRPADT